MNVIAVLQRKYWALSNTQVAGFRALLDCHKNGDWHEHKYTRTKLGRLILVSSVSSAMKVVVRELSNGVLMPAVGLGSYESKEDASDVILSAFEYGYKGVDTADFYQNYPAIRSALDRFEAKYKGITECPVTEEICLPKGCKVVSEEEYNASFKHPHGSPDGHRLFVTTKVWPQLSAQKVRETVDHFMSACNRAQIDMLVIHWPGLGTEFGGSEEEMRDPKNAERRLEAWHEMEKQYAQGRLRGIGVSNFTLKHLKPLIEDIKTRQTKGDPLAMMPMINQIEISPWILPEKELEEYCEANRIILESYSPMGSGARVKQCMNDPVIQALSAKYSKPPGNVILRAMLDRGYLIIPKSSNPKRVIENYDLFGFCISREDLTMMDKELNKQVRTYPNPHDIA